jgi:hypothetical protein
VNIGRANGWSWGLKLQKHIYTEEIGHCLVDFYQDCLNKSQQ